MLGPHGGSDWSPISVCLAACVCVGCPHLPGRGGGSWHSASDEPDLLLFSPWMDCGRLQLCSKPSLFPLHWIIGRFQELRDSAAVTGLWKAQTEQKLL